MHYGHVISGIGHLGFIGWALFGNVLVPPPPPLEVTEVSIVTSEEYAAITASDTPPGAETQVEPLQPPAAEAPAAPPEVSAAEDAPPETSEPPAAEASEPDAAPEQPQPQPTPPAEVADAPPEITPPSSEDVAVLEPETPPSPEPQPRDVPRVAPRPVPRPEQDVQVGEEVRETAEPDQPTEPVQEQEEATAPEEATTEIVTEADEPKSSAPTKSVRPKSRPPVQTAAVEKPVETPAERPAPKPAEKPAETPAPKPAETPAPKPAETPKPDANAGSSSTADSSRADQKDAVNDALAKALGTAGDAPATPSGPPLTGGEKEALRVAVSNCWNTGSLSTDALRVTVVIEVSMTEDARPVTSSIRMVSAQGGSDSAARQAFEAARRAIIRCGANGFALPREKYDHWRDIEMTFNPEKMRVK